MSFSTLSLSMNSVGFISTSVGQLLPCAIHVSSVFMVNFSIYGILFTLVFKNSTLGIGHFDHVESK